MQKWLYCGVADLLLLLVPAACIHYILDAAVGGGGLPLRHHSLILLLFLTFQPALTLSELCSGESAKRERGQADGFRAASSQLVGVSGPGCAPRSSLAARLYPGFGAFRAQLSSQMESAVKNADAFR